MQKVKKNDVRECEGEGSCIVHKTASLRTQRPRARGMLVADCFVAQHTTPFIIFPCNTVFENKKSPPVYWEAVSKFTLR